MTATTDRQGTPALRWFLACIWGVSTFVAAGLAELILGRSAASWTTWLVPLAIAAGAVLGTLLVSRLPRRRRDADGWTGLGDRR